MTPNGKPTPNSNAPIAGQANLGPEVASGVFGVDKVVGRLVGTGVAASAGVGSLIGLILGSAVGTSTTMVIGRLAAVKALRLSYYK
jgi:hypothetical protein